MTYQSPMKRFKSTRRSMARNGGFESEPNWQPEQNIARVAINNERQALLFGFIILWMVCVRGHVGKVNACTAREGTW